MLTDEIYKNLKHYNLVAGHKAFSLDFLNQRNPRYYDDIISAHRQPSVSALLSLYIRLTAIANVYGASSSYSSLANDLRAQAAELWAEVERRTCSLLPAKGKRPAPTRVIQGYKQSGRY